MTGEAQYRNRVASCGWMWRARSRRSAIPKDRLARAGRVKDYPPPCMILLTPKTGLARGTARGAAKALLATCSLLPAVVNGAPDVRIGDQSDPEHETVPPATVPRLELSYPGAAATSTDRWPLQSSTLRLDDPAYLAPSAPPPAPPAGFRESSYHWGFSAEPRLSALLLWPEPRLTTSKKSQLRLTPAADDRSAWARWHSSIWGASASIGALMITTVATLSLLPSEISGWNKPNFYGLRRTFSTGPSFDYDHAYFHYIFHPDAGSEFYLIARNRRLNWWQSFAYGVAVSTTFEVLIESAYEGASWQDLWITPVSGAVIGELRWQAKKSLEDSSTGKPSGTWNKILYVLVDPLDAIFNL